MEAIVRASFLISEFHDMKIYLSKIRTYSIDLQSGRFEAKDQHDHQRLPPQTPIATPH